LHVGDSVNQKIIKAIKTLFKSIKSLAQKANDWLASQFSVSNPAGYAFV